MLIFKFCVILTVVILITRLPYLTGPIDGHHAWRQCDTANYAREFHAHGLNILKPSVCWLGNHKTYILEFPFPEFLTALAYHVFGYDLTIARILTLIFFTGSAIFLMLIIGEVRDLRFGLISALVYAVLPLGIEYSRAVHIDFPVIFFSHATVYYLLLSKRSPKWVYTFLAFISCLLGFLIKAPYVFFLFLPLSIHALVSRNKRYFFRIFACFSLSAAGFILWRCYADSVNAAIPDLSFVPGFRGENQWEWYFGSAGMRLDPAAWKVLLNRFRYYITSQFGLPLFITGFLYSIYSYFRTGIREIRYLWLWTVGLGIYLMVFFNLNYVHSYYQIPFLPIAAVYIALAISIPLFHAGNRAFPASCIASFLLLVALAHFSLEFSAGYFFRIDHSMIQAGKIVSEVTPENSLIVSSLDHYVTKWSDPRFLFHMNRNGWSIETRSLNETVLLRFRALGAEYLAILSENAPADADMNAREFPLEGTRKKLFLTKL